MGIKEHKKNREQKKLEIVIDILVLTVFVVFSFTIGWLLRSEHSLLTLKVLAGVFGIPTCHVLLWFVTRIGIITLYNKYKRNKEKRNEIINGQNDREF